MIDLNPLDVLKRRKMDFLPVHFAKAKIPSYTMWDNSIEKWVQQNLKGRYCITKALSINGQGKLLTDSILGLEDHKEMTFFMLACPHYRR